MQKKPIIIISVLCVISLVLGYLSGLKEEERLSNGGAETNSKKEPEFLKQGLVAYYPFNGNAKDESGNGYDGTGNEPLVFIEDRFKKPVSALVFDGQDDHLGINHKIFSDTNFSISMWLRIEGITSNDMRLINGGLDLSIKIGLDQTIKSWWSNTSIKDYPVSGRVTLGNWHHFLIKKNSDQILFFFDGKKERFAAYPFSGPAQFFEFGSPYRDASLVYGSYFKGGLDDIRIYNRALSHEEVKALYEFEKAN